MKNVGIDIVENDRIRKVIGTGFVKKVLSSEEQERFEGFSEERKVQFLAGRFAAKEAIIKALTDYEVPLMKDLNIVNNEKGKPEIEYKDYIIHLSISHERNYATAVAVLDGFRERNEE